MKRRAFLQTTTIGSTASLLFPSLVSGMHSMVGQDGRFNNMGGLTPVSVIDNACLLAYASGKLSPESQKSVVTDIHLRDTAGNKGRLAAILPALDIKILELANKVKGDAALKYKYEKRSILFGWIAINSVQRNINLHYSYDSEEKAFGSRIHQDVLVIQSFSDEKFDIRKVSVSDVEDLLRSIQTRTITRVHTLKPDSDDGIGWVNRMTAWRKKSSDEITKYSRALLHPDPEIAGKNFLRRDDAVIRTANLLQLGELVSADAVLSNLSAGNNTSVYAVTLLDAVKGILKADEYLLGKIGLAELKGYII